MSDTETRALQAIEEIKRLQEKRLRLQWVTLAVSLAILALLILGLIR